MAAAGTRDDLVTSRGDPATVMGGVRHDAASLEATEVARESVRGPAVADCVPHPGSVSLAFDVATRARAAQPLLQRAPGEIGPPRTSEASPKRAPSTSDWTFDVLFQPQVPGLGQGAIGGKRNADGTWTLVVGGEGKTVAASDIPSLARRAVGDGAASEAGPAKPPARVDIPSCKMITDRQGNALPYSAYRAAQSVRSGEPLSQAMYSRVLESCAPLRREDLPTPDPPRLDDLPGPDLPAGEAYS